MITKSHKMAFSLVLCIALWSLGLFATATRSEAVTYTYDNMNRLISAKYDNGQEIKYAYDEAGNILTVISKAPVVSVSREPEEAAAAPSRGRRN
jgi:YD repeat-containing protein